MKIRRLTESDADYAEFLPLIREFRDTSFTAAQFRAQLAQIETAGGEIWVADESGTLYATATVLYEPKFIRDLATVAHVEDVCVKTSMRGLGLGKQLIQHVCAAAKDKGCYKILLDCTDENVEFYHKCGLNRVGNQMCVYYV